MLRTVQILPSVVLTYLFAISFVPIPAKAQIIINGVAQNSDSNTQNGFSVHKDSQNVSEAMEDFERYRDKKAWEKAIGAFNKLLDAKPTGLVADKNGFYISSTEKVQAELLSLPADGREAYRLFNDAKAQQMLNDATARASDATGGKSSSGEFESTEQSNPDDISSLREIVQRYFITTSGDRAADRLGDALFESGDFDGAARSYRLILDSYPDTNLSPALLQTKLALALARAGRWTDFQSVQSVIHDRFAGQNVTVAGKSVVASEYVDTLAKDRPATTVPSPETASMSVSTFVSAAGHGVSLPTDDTPIWQIPLIDADMTKQIEQALQQYGWMQMAGKITNAIPPTAIDHKRIYVNWLGCCFAADLQTGKMLWRTGALANLAQNFQQAVMQGQFGSIDGFSVALAGDRVLFVRRDISNSPGPSHLLCLDARTGKTYWDSGNLAMADWCMIGQPIIIDGTIYVCAHGQSNQELNLLCIGLEKGDLHWSLVLGNPTLGTDFRGSTEEKVPSLLAYQQKIYVQTNNGAILQINPTSKSIDWAFTYATEGPEGRQVFFYNQQMPPDTDAPGAFIARNSTLYLKERGGDEVYAIDLAGPSLLWKRPLETTAALVGCDDDHLWAAGADVDCIDLHTRDLRWSNKLSTAIGNIQPVLSSGHLYVFGKRGIHDISTDSGDTAPLFRGYDRDTLGGFLWQTPDRLITVSNTAITAYPTAGGHQP
jgi:outer membrane protein assembly factor BamB/tetratricopeptide (TPR) repeat protein